MLEWKQRCARTAATSVVFALCAVSLGFAAQNHVVSPAEIQKAAVDATHARTHNVETVTQFLSSPRAKPALASAHLNPAQVQTAISKMTDEEVAELASRVNQSQTDFAAGNMSNRDLLWLVLAVVVLLLVIIAVR